MTNIPFYLVSVVWLTALFNPVFKKYDYGAGLPMVVLLATSVLVILLCIRKEKREKAGLEIYFLFGYMLALLISFLNSSALGVGLSEFLAFESAALLYLIIAYRKISWMPRFLKVVGWAAVVSAGLGFVLYIGFDEVRMVGPFLNKLNHAHTWPNAFALFLLMTWPILLLEKRKWPLALVLAALLLTFSRGAMLVFGGQLLMLTIYFGRRIRWRELGVIALITVALFLTANQLRSQFHPVVEIEEKLTLTDDEGSSSTSDRFVFWRGALELIKEKPMFGWGPFSFRQAYSGIQKGLLETADHPHNLFLKIGAENGVLALIGFLGFLIMGLVTLIRRFSVLGDKKDTVAVLVVAVAGTIAHNLIDYNLNFVATLLPLFLFLAFIRSLTVNKKSEHNSKLFLALAILLALVASYEAGVQGLKIVLDDEEFLDYSLYPRAHYLDAGDYEKAIWWNELEAGAYFEKGDWQTALRLNPLNDFRYYVAYIGQKNSDLKVVVDLLETYFGFVEHNTHFTAYTGNVEAAAELIDLIVERDENYQYLIGKKKKMLADAEHARNNKPL